MRRQKIKNDKKSIAIIGEGYTEYFYFNSLRNTKRYKRLHIFPSMPNHTDIEHIINCADEKCKQPYDFVICLIDMDRIQVTPKERQKYQVYKNKKKDKIIFIETNPCIEFWFLLHFFSNPLAKSYTKQDDLIDDLRKYMPNYEKTQDYLKRSDIYKCLIENGNIEKAVKHAKQLCKLASQHPDEDISYSEIYKVIDLLEKLNPE